MKDLDADPDHEVLRVKSQFHRSSVQREGNVIIKEGGPWTAAVHSLLRHLEEVGFEGASRLAGSGLDSDSHETLTYIEGEFMQPGPWSLEGAAAVGQLVRDLHSATASFRPASDAVWWPWFGRALGGGERVIGHCDTAPWNIVARDGLPIALIDWERAGSVYPLVELAQTCWLNAKLHDDEVAEREGLPSLSDRAVQLRAIVDAYGLTKKQRRGFVDKIIEFVIHDVAEQGDEADITHETDLASIERVYLWSFAWRSRAAAWIYRNRRTLQNALV